MKTKYLSVPLFIDVYVHLSVYLFVCLFGTFPVQSQLSVQIQTEIIVDPLNMVVMVNYGMSPNPQFQLNSRFEGMLFVTPEFGEG